MTAPDLAQQLVDLDYAVRNKDLIIGHLRVVSHEQDQRIAVLEAALATERALTAQLQARLVVVNSYPACNSD